jgi:hypothetical protein
MIRGTSLKPVLHSMMIVAQLCATKRVKPQITNVDRHSPRMASRCQFLKAHRVGFQDIPRALDWACVHLVLVDRSSLLLWFLCVGMAVSIMASSVIVAMVAIHVVIVTHAH